MEGYDVEGCEVEGVGWRGVSGEYGMEGMGWRVWGGEYEGEGRSINKDRLTEVVLPW